MLELGVIGACVVIGVAIFISLWCRGVLDRREIKDHGPRPGEKWYRNTVSSPWAIERAIADPYTVDDVRGEWVKYSRDSDSYSKEELISDFMECHERLDT